MCICTRSVLKIYRSLPSAPISPKLQSRGQYWQEAIFLRIIISAGSKISRTVLAEAKCDGQSLEAKIGGLVYTTVFWKVAIYLRLFRLVR